MGELEDKVALVTGGGSGIGRAIAVLLADEGASVVVSGRRAGPLEDTVAEIRRAGGQAGSVTADQAVESDVEKMVRSAVEQFGGLDIVVNNASIVGPVGPVAEMDLQGWEETLRVNLTGAMLCCRAAVPAMIDRGSGAIVNVSSNIGRRGFPDRAPYVCSKWALQGLTQTLALELAQCNIRVNAICPGPVMTERLKGAMERMAEARGISLDDVKEEWVADSPMKRFATVDECAKVVLFLVSNASSGMTGSTMVVDGGTSIPY